MKLDESPRSDNVEDQRGSGIGRGAGIGIGTIVIVVIGYFLGINPATLLSLLNGDPQTVSAPAQAPTAADANDPQVDFVRAILGDTELVWGAYFQNMGKVYARPSWCSSTIRCLRRAGWRILPPDRSTVPAIKRFTSISLLPATGDAIRCAGEFARAYVIAHEVGHHVQNLLGITGSAVQSERRAGRVGANQVSVRVELQADCFAGVWAQQANRARKVLEPGELDQGLAAASAVGDDALQKRTQGTVIPDSFTHGTSAQRVRWFRRGFDSGKIDNCDTFSAGESL